MRASRSLAVAFFCFLGCASTAIRPAGSTESSAPQAPSAATAPSAAPKRPSKAVPLPLVSTAPPPIEIAPPPNTLEPSSFEPNRRSIDGTGPLALEAVGPSGRWLAYCESRAGGGSPELRFATLRDGDTKVVARDVDELLGASPGGRYVVLATGSRVALVDATTDEELDLAPLAPSLARDAFPDHRSFAFSDDDRTLAVLGADDRVVHLIPLAKAFASPLDPTRLVRVPLSTAAYRIEYQGTSLVIRHATGSAWPTPRGKGPELRCRSSARFAAYAALSEPNAAFKRSTSLLPRGASAPLEAPGFVFALGSSWVRREADGRLLLVEGASQKQIASARCGGRILHASASRKLFVVACEEYRPTPPADAPKTSKKPPPPRFRFPVYLLGPGYVLDLEVETMRTGVDVPPSVDDPRFVFFRPGDGTALVDLDRRSVERATSDTFLLAESDDALLLEKSGRLVRRAVARSLGSGRFDRAEPTRDTPLDVVIEPFSARFFRGPFFATPTRSGNWSTLRVTPRRGEPLYLGRTGVLVSLAPDSTTELVVERIEPPSRASTTAPVTTP